MKQFTLALVLMLLVGCSFGEKEIPTETTAQTISAFSIESGDTGLILKNSNDESFENILSTHPILEADIEDGILTYTEFIDGVPMTRAINLEAFVQFLNE